jgi:undecaprenyl-diphosphatase
VTLGEQVSEVIEDVTKLALITAFLFVALQFYLKRRPLSWSEPFTRHRIAVLVAIALGVLAIKIVEDVLGKESGPFDEPVLRFIHEHASPALTAFFSAVTLTGSFRFLFAAATATTIALFLVRRRFEAFLVAASTAAGGALVYLIKIAVGRARPSLWQTQDYWGWSFPSGHTLGTAAFATALCIAAIRIGPTWRSAITFLATVWVLLVGLSRLVLGAHWPTDVLAAGCLGTLIPLVISVIATATRDIRTGRRKRFPSL